MRNRLPKNQAGMTLIELMVAVCIVGILTMIAYPNYSTYVVRSKRNLAIAGALVAEAVMDIGGLSELVLCPWALREGVILERLDALAPAD